MDIAEQEMFVKELTGAVIKELLDDIRAGKVPDTWNGIELRQLLADRFERAVFRGTLTGKRLREYRNTVLVNNL